GLVSLAHEATTSLTAGKHVLELIGATQGVSYTFSLGVRAARASMASISQTSGPHIPILGQVTCAKDGTTQVLTPEMQVSAGGAWVVVRNDSGARGLELRTLADANENQGGSIRPSGDTYRRVVLPPGVDLVACYQKGESIPDRANAPQYER